MKFFVLDNIFVQVENSQPPLHNIHIPAAKVGLN